MNTASNNAAVLKTVYAKKLGTVLHDEKSFPLWNLLKKKPGNQVKLPMGGSAFVQPVHVASAHTFRPTFSASQTAAANNSSNIVSFQSTVKQLYVTKQVDGVFSALTQSGNDAAFVDAVSFAIDEALRDMRAGLGRYAYGTGFGNICPIIAAPTSTTIKIAQGNLGLVEQGMPIVAAQSVSGHVLRSATALTITKVGSDGTLTLSGDPTALSWANGDIIFLEGTRQNSATPSRLMFHGLAGLNPVTVPGSGENFDGVDRSQNYKLYGLRWNAADSSNLKDAIITASGLLRSELQEPDYCLMNPMDWTKLNISLDNISRVLLPNDETAVKFGYATIGVAGPGGIIKCVSDPGCPQGQAHMIDSRHVFWTYAGDDIVHFAANEPYITKDGADAVEIRVRSIPELVTDQPNSMCVIYGIT